MFFKDKTKYSEYLEKNKVDSKVNDIRKYFEFSEEGEVLLEKGMLRASTIDVEKYTSCIQWAMLDDNETMVLLKYQFGDLYRDISIQDYYTAMYNNILLPEIASQFQNKSARYFIAKNKTKKKAKFERKYILTIDFKEENEELMHGEDILEDLGRELNETNIEVLINSIEEYLKKYGYNTQDIERIKIDFIKQSFFNRFIKQYDENNHNWGILINEKNKFARIAPMYDMECSCEINKKSKIIRKTNNGSLVGLYDFIEQYKEEQWFKIYIEELKQSFNLEKAFIDAKENTNFEIPNEYKEKYRNFFALRFQELKQAYDKVYENEEKEKSVEDNCNIK